MISTPSARQELQELVECEILDSAMLVELEAKWLERLLEGQDDAATSAHLRLGAKNKVITQTDGIPIDVFMAVAQGVRRFAQNDSLDLEIHGAIVSMNLEPTWHADNISNAFVVTTQGATEGLAGTAEGSTTVEALYKAIELGNSDPDFSNVPEITVVRHALHSLLHVPAYAAHRSAQPDRPKPDKKLIINARLAPSFTFFK